MADSNVQRRRITPATIVLALAAVLALVAIIIAVSRSGEDPAATANQPASNTQAPMNPEMAIAALQQQLQQNPDNAEGWAMLGRTYREMNRFGEAEAAFRRSSELQPANSDFVSYRAEAMLLQGGDERRAEARRLFQRAVELDGANPMARFYLATLRDQSGDPRGAIDDLIALLASAPPNAPWYSFVRDQTEQLARLRNIDVASRLPAARPTSPATAAIPGPSRQQLEAARSLPPGQQQEMAKAMVDRLAARLQQNPRDERGWMMLMRSRMVQGERDQAAAALRTALGAFQSDPAAQQRLRTAAAELGVPAS
jgi:cytochrome c-type biogenesis protein CcmH